MDILVEGTGKISIRPNNVKLSFEFNTKDNTYEETLKNGVKNTEVYIALLEKIGFDKTEIKTRAFKISENKIYNEEKKKYVADGFIYTQNAILEFDYDMAKLSEFMEITSKAVNAPSYQIYFGVKDDKKLEERLLANAYKDAEFQANAIAKACAEFKTLTCKKVSFKSFDENFISRTSFDAIEKMSYSRSISESIQNIFVPEDIQVQKTIYCIFEAN